MFTLKRKPLSMPAPGDALPGRPQPIPTAKTHFVSGAALKGPYPQGAQEALFGLGCLWAAAQACWESHTPAQGMRQGNDVGTQYRSGIYYHTDEQRRAAEASKEAYEGALKARGPGPG